MDCMWYIHVNTMRGVFVCNLQGLSERLHHPHSYLFPVIVAAQRPSDSKMNSVHTDLKESSILCGDILWYVSTKWNSLDKSSLHSVKLTATVVKLLSNTDTFLLHLSKDGERSWKAWNSTSRVVHMHEDHVLVTVQNGVELQTDIKSQTVAHSSPVMFELVTGFFLPNQQDQLERGVTAQLMYTNTFRQTYLWN